MVDFKTMRFPIYFAIYAKTTQLCENITVQHFFDSVRSIRILKNPQDAESPRPEFQHISKREKTTPNLTLDLPLA